MRVTLKTINAELAKRGHNTHLERACEYFYFAGGEASDWLQKTVAVPAVSSLTLDGWLGEFDRSKNLNAQLLKTPNRKPKPKASS